jgi:uncharacterized protein
MKRVYNSLLQEHLQQHQQMLFISGPRRVGKTTISTSEKNFTKNFLYLNWDNQEHKHIIISGGKQISSLLNLDKIQDESAKKPIVVFDEVHKYKKWKNFLKGFFDTYGEQVHIIVTGSSKLNIFIKGGDSLMGRYFPYRIHPFSVAECIYTDLPIKEIRQPKLIEAKLFQALFDFGGFPEPFIKQDQRFLNRWKKSRKEQLLREDIRDLTRIQENGQLEILAFLIQQQTGQLVNYSNLANKVNVTIDTIRRWIATLNSFYYCFTIKPWTKNVSRSLLKEPKIYLWDWSDITDIGAKCENFIASHLLKAVHFWTDYGFGDYDLYFLRDKEKREVDFLVTKNNEPWFIVEVKHSSNSGLNKNLFVFQKQINPAHVFQVVFDMEPTTKDCFSYNKPIIVPAQTFLSQLI